jgi:hypothetical protein
LNAPFGQTPPFTPAPQPPFFAPPYPIQPNIQTNPSFNQTQGMNSLNPPYSQFQCFTPQLGQTQNPFCHTPPTTETITTLKGIPFWELTQHVNPTPKTFTSFKTLNNPLNSSKKSRRIIQRRRKRYYKKELINLNLETTNRIQQKKQIPRLTI